MVAGKIRCKLHGGLSTGPKTAAGRRRSLKALAAGRAAYVARRTAAAEGSSNAECFQSCIPELKERQAELVAWIEGRTVAGD